MGKCGNHRGRSQSQYGMRVQGLSQERSIGNIWFGPICRRDSFGASEPRGSLSLDQTRGGGRVRNWLGIKQKSSWLPAKPGLTSRLSRKMTPLHCPSPNRHFLNPMLVPRALLSCQFQRPFLLMSKPRPDFIIKCAPHQDKQAPVQSLS